jgi:hypothetical protein
VPTLWIRKCWECRTADFRKSWDGQAAAHADTTLNDLPSWDPKPGWTCPTCGSHAYSVEQRHP